MKYIVTFLLIGLLAGCDGTSSQGEAEHLTFTDPPTIPDSIRDNASESAMDYFKSLRSFMRLSEESPTLVALPGFPFQKLVEKDDQKVELWEFAGYAEIRAESRIDHVAENGYTLKIGQPITYRMYLTTKMAVDARTDTVRKLATILNHGQAMESPDAAEAAGKLEDRFLKRAKELHFGDK